MPLQNIVLTGFMGTGKSTIGRLLAVKLGYTLIDTDQEIEKKSGKSIPDIFADEGEAAFRKMETDTAIELSKRAGLVISTGGKLMLDSQNAEALLATSAVFCLVATPDTIIQRVKTDKGTRRPLLDTPNPEATVHKLLKEREEGYGKFNQVDTTGKPPETIADEIIQQLEAFNQQT